MKRLIALLVALCGPLAIGQISYTNTPYTQNFNGLISAGNAGWTDNSTLAGWSSDESQIYAGNGLLADVLASHLVSYGTTAGDRALGSNTGLLGDVIFGFHLVNNTGTTMTGFTLSYTAEQWSRATGGALGIGLLDTASVQYSLTAGDVDGGLATGYTTIPAASYTTPSLLSATLLGSNLDGNAVANRQFISATVTGLSLADGDDLWVRWTRASVLNIGAGIAIDDLTFTAAVVPEPSVVALVLAGLIAVAVTRFRRASRVLPLFVAVGLGGALWAKEDPIRLQLQTDSVILRYSDGGRRMLPLGSSGERIACGNGRALLSYGRDYDGAYQLVLAPDAELPHSSTYTVANHEISVTSDAVVSFRFPSLSQEPVIDVGLVGTVKVDGKVVAVSTSSVPMEEHRISLTYDPLWDSMMIEDDFKKISEMDHKRGDLVVVDSSQYKAAGQLFVANVPTDGPTEVWLRHESFVPMKLTTAQTEAEAEPFLLAQNNQGLTETVTDSPGASPEGFTFRRSASVPILRLLNSSDLFADDVSIQDRSAYLKSIKLQMEETTKQVRALLAKSQTTPLTPEEQAFMQKTGQVVWLVRAKLTDSSRPDLAQDLGEEIMRAQISRVTRLQPLPTTPF
jgi:hypothetical protein